jgi:hypothetical protein
LAEGGYANFEYDVQYNETFETDTNTEVEQDGNADPLRKDKHVIQPMGRGGARFPISRGGRQGTVYRQLNIHHPGPMDTDGALTVFDPKTAGMKRDGTVGKIIWRGGVTPEPKKKRVTPTNTNSSEQAAGQPRREQ